MVTPRIINNGISCDSCNNQRCVCPQLFLSICFVHPDCYQAAPPAAARLEEADLASLSPLARDLADNLRNRRTEAARNLLVAALSNVQERVTRQDNILDIKYF